MDMKLWNFLERASGIENKIIYLQHYFEENEDAGDKNVHLQINVEDVDSETIEVQYIVWANSYDECIEKANSIVTEYFSDDEVIQHV